MKKKFVLITKSVNADFSSHHDSSFIYPKSGIVTAPDYLMSAECGNGLHGFLHGKGDGSLAKYVESVWLVIKVEKNNEIIELNGKVKFKTGEVVLHGDLQTVVKYLLDYGVENNMLIGGTATAGDSGTATAGYSGTATAGDSGTATAGDSGTATAGYSGTATAGYSGVIIIKYYVHDKGIYIPVVGVIGENGLKPNVKYKLNDANQFVEA